MSERLTGVQIDDLAARWVARSHGRELAGHEALELESWLAQDDRHLGAYAKAMAVMCYTNRARALSPAMEYASPMPPRLTRRAAVLAGSVAATLAACLTGAALVVANRNIRNYSTGIGETRVVSLEDGSVITLNTASKIAVEYSRKSRKIHLVTGEGLFDVAKDPARPFFVRADDVQVRAVGTSFTVCLLPQQMPHVLVREGVVEIQRRDIPAAAPLLMSANTVAYVRANVPIVAEKISEVEVKRKLVWREGRIAFTGETLRQAAQSFQRYSDTRIIIDDDSIADRTVAGLFVSNDPVGFARAVALSMNLHAETGDNEVRLTR